MDDNEWDDNSFPLAYLITFRTYGTWLHGNDRSSVDLRGQNLYRSPKVSPNSKLESEMARRMSGSPFVLNHVQRVAVDAAIREVCNFRDYELNALNIRTNHVHVVVGANCAPDPIATAFKSYSTRRMRTEGLVKAEQRIWSRGQSTRYLRKENHVGRAIEYVLYGQGD